MRKLRVCGSPAAVGCYAIRAVQWKRERGRAPEVTSQDPWERQLAEGVAAFARYRAQAAANG